MLNYQRVIHPKHSFQIEILSKHSANHTCKPAWVSNSNSEGWLPCFHLIIIEQMTSEASEWNCLAVELIKFSRLVRHIFQALHVQETQTHLQKNMKTLINKSTLSGSVWVSSPSKTLWFFVSWNNQCSWMCTPPCQTRMKNQSRAQQTFRKPHAPHLINAQ